MRPLVLLALAVTFPAYGNHSAAGMTGAELVDLFQRPRGELNKLELSAAQLHREIVGEAYIDGVHDATQGKGWCHSRQNRLSHATVQEQVIWGLRAMPAEKLRRNAAGLIVEILASKFPCPTKGRKS